MVEMLHFRGSWEIIEGKNLDNDVKVTMEYLEECLYGALYRRELTALALKEMGWREGDLRILENRQYRWSGFKKGVALECNLSSYEYLWLGLMRIQYSFDKGDIDTGIVILTDKRSENSRLGTSIELAKNEVEMLYPTISLPCSVAFLSIDEPDMIEEEFENENPATGINEKDRSEEGSEEEPFEPFP
jgi:hypothetical protein